MNKKMEAHKKGAPKQRLAPYVLTEKITAPLGKPKRNIPVQSTEWPDHWTNRVHIDVFIEQDLIRSMRDYMNLNDDATYMDIINKINRQVGKAMFHALTDMYALDVVKTTVAISIDREEINKERNTKEN